MITIANHYLTALLPSFELIIDEFSVKIMFIRKYLEAAAKICLSKKSNN